jgi:hypothetical protein
LLFIIIEDYIYINILFVKEYLCNKACWEEFAGFLYERLVSKKSERKMARDAALQILSAAKETVRGLFPTHSIWVDHSSSKDTPVDIRR